MEFSLFYILVIVMFPQITEQRKCRFKSDLWDESFIRQIRSDVPDDGDAYAHLTHPYLADIVHAFQFFYPHLEPTNETGLHHCAGTVLTRNLILTACHCLAELNPEVAIRSIQSYVVVVGSVTNEMGQWRRAGRFAIHPLCGYYGASVSYDVGIISLLKPLLYSRVVRPIKFFSFDRKILSHEYERLVRTGAICDSPGWGKSQRNMQPKNELLEREVVLINAQQCRTMFCAAKYRPEILCYQNFDARKQICVAAARGVIPCYGDSGGPLICRGNIFGLVSWGGDCSPDAPEVYTSPLVILDFVKTYVLATKAAAH